MAISTSIALIGFLTFGPNQFADHDWYRVSIDTQLTFRYIDLRSIYEANGTRRAWVATVFGNVSEAQGPDTPKDALGLVEVDCEERRNRYLTFSAYGFQRRHLGESNEPTEWQYVPRQHPMNSVMDAICLPPESWGQRDFQPVPDGNYRADRANFIFSAMGDGAQN